MDTLTQILFFSAVALLFANFLSMFILTCMILYDEIKERSKTRFKQRRTK